MLLYGASAKLNGSHLVNRVNFDVHEVYFTEPLGCFIFPSLFIHDSSVRC